MQYGEIIASVLTAVLLACMLAISLFMSARPLWPEPRVRMVILMPVDALTTASLRTGDYPNLPKTFDINMAQLRPERH